MASAGEPSGGGSAAGQVADVEHVEVCFQEKRFAAWPANNGIWAWGDEILVGFALGEHEDRAGHTLRPGTAVSKFARSLDGGRNWSIEDGYERGIRASSINHHLGKDLPPVDCPGGIDFIHPDFALTFRRMNNANGPSHFYYSHDRGKSWQGAFKFPQFETGIANRTAYLVEGKHKLLAFLTAGKSNGREGRVACARTSDGGKSWRRVAWIGPEPDEGYALMPAAVRLSPERILVVVRRQRLPDHMGLIAYLSEDNARSWRRVEDPVPPGRLRGSSPPALIQISDGRLCLVYAVREHEPKPSRICVRFSADRGATWTNETVLREDRSNWDCGYTRAVQRTDGKVVAVYYYNQVLGGSPYRHIAATLFRPAI